MTMDSSAISTIASLAEKAAGQTVEIDGVTYSPVTLTDPRKPEPEATPLVCSRLSSLVKYIEEIADVDGESIAGVHVKNAHLVEVFGRSYGRFKQRDCLARAQMPQRMNATEFGFEEWLDLDSMIIALQALFENAWDRAKVLKLLGTVKDEAVRTQSDDGVTQTVTARSGIAVVEEATVPNPVTLAPRRTFDEIAQPESPFILRMKKGLQVALFEADGGRWESEAVASIASHLLPQISDSIPILW